MKKKILNILKYSIGLIVACSIFIISLFISANAETKYDNLLLNYIQKIELWESQNVKLTEFSNVRFQEIEDINMLVSDYGYDYEQDLSNTSFVKYILTQPIELNNKNTLVANHFGFNNTISLNYGNNIVKQIQLNGVSGQLYYYGFNETITIDNIIINNDGQDFAEDSPQFAIITKNDNSYYNQGYQDAWNKQEQNLENEYQRYRTLQRQYNSLLNQYNQLATNEYTFENLFWSVGSVPMAFLMQSFNVNVLGLNIRAIITGLITALIVIWLIKKLLK